MNLAIIEKWFEDIQEVVSELDCSIDEIHATREEIAVLTDELESEDLSEDQSEEQRYDIEYLEGQVDDLTEFVKDQAIMLRDLSASMPR